MDSKCEINDESWSKQIVRIIRKVWRIIKIYLYHRNNGNINKSNISKNSGK